MKANLHGSEGPAQYASCLWLSSTLHVAEDNGLPVLFGETIDLFMQKRVIDRFRPGLCVVLFVRHFGLSALGDSPASRITSGAPRYAEGCTVQPRPEGFRLPNGSGLPCQYQKDSLCCILRFMLISKNVAAHAVNHRPMALD
jgi:hypothetical protein